MILSNTVSLDSAPDQIKFSGFSSSRHREKFLRSREQEKVAQPGEVRTVVAKLILQKQIAMTAVLRYREKDASLLPHSTAPAADPQLKPGILFFDCGKAV
jgi:hypothetical protein